MTSPKFKRDKFIELVLYVSERSETDSKFGETKLNKLLFYADFLAYRDFGRAITGARYQKLPFGPAAVAMKPIQEELVADGDLVIRPGLRGGYEQKKPIALRDPDLSTFSGIEIALVDELIKSFWDLDATQISHLSHNEIGWRLGQLGEDIPYETIFVESIRPAEAWN